MVVVVILGILAAPGRAEDHQPPGRGARHRREAGHREPDAGAQALSPRQPALPHDRAGTAGAGRAAGVGAAAPNWKAGGYVERLPKDPWGNPYQYLNPGVRGELDVFSMGADGAPGGEGNDADIGSWNL